MHACSTRNVAQFLFLRPTDWKNTQIRAAATKLITYCSIYCAVYRAPRAFKRVYYYIDFRRAIKTPCMYIFRVYTYKRFQYTKVVVGDEIFIYRRITYVIILRYMYYNSPPARHPIKLLYIMEFLKTIYKVVVRVYCCCSYIYICIMYYTKREKVIFSFYFLSSLYPLVVDYLHVNTRAYIVRALQKNIIYESLFIFGRIDRERCHLIRTKTSCLSE